MLNFKDELSRYQPLLELDQIESSLQPAELQDVMDILQHIVNEREGKEPTQQPSES